MNTTSAQASAAMRRVALWAGLLLCAPLAAQTASTADHGAHTQAGTGAPPGTAASRRASKPAARKRSMLGTGAAFAPDGALWISTLDGQGRLNVQRSMDRGRTWEPPRVLDTGGDTVAADGESWPKIAFSGPRTVVISYTHPLAKPYTGEIRLLRSDDGGASFAPPVTVHHDRQVITHRFDAIAFDAKGVLHALWIDKRDLEAAKASGQKYRGAAIYRAESHDGGRSFGPDTRVADHSCECCRIALAPATGGGVAAMWRHVFEPNLRDHAFAVLGGAAPASPGDPALVRASLDHWAVDGCPHHGPGLTAASEGGYHAVWFGQRQGRAAVRYGRLSARGEPQGAARELPDDAAEHADIQSAGRHVAIVWRSFDGQATRWRAWISADDGQTFTLRELGRSTLDNDHPRLLRQGQALVALWRDAEGVRVETLVP